MCVCLCVYIYISHTFFIHSSVMDRMGCFHILAVANNAAMNIGCMYLFELVFLFSLDIYERVELLDHVVILFSVF